MGLNNLMLMQIQLPEILLCHCQQQLITKATHRSGRELHGFLEVGTRYDTWFNRMVGYGFTEGEDFIPVLEKVDAQKRART